MSATKLTHYQDYLPTNTRMICINTKMYH